MIAQAGRLINAAACRMLSLQCRPLPGQTLQGCQPCIAVIPICRGQACLHISNNRQARTLHCNMDVWRS